MKRRARYSGRPKAIPEKELGRVLELLPEGWTTFSEMNLPGLMVRIDKIAPGGFRVRNHQALSVLLIQLRRQGAIDYRDDALKGPMLRRTSR